MAATNEPDTTTRNSAPTRTSRRPRRTTNLKNDHPLRSITGAKQAAPNDSAAEQDTTTTEQEQQQAAPAQEQPPASSESTSTSQRGTGPTIPYVRSKDTKRLGLYISPEEHKILTLARAEDDIDANTRMRAMLALWRSNERFRRQVDRLAKNTTKGIHG